MKITFPHMGNMWVALKGMLEFIGLEVVVPPATSKKALSLGVRNTPESACLPLKINLGNLLEALELGADTILMAGGVGSCRFGPYARLLQEILEDMAQQFNMIVLEPSEQGIMGFLKNIAKIKGSASWWKIMQAVRFGYRKAYYLDRAELLVEKIRPRENAAGTADKIYEHVLKTIDAARNFGELEDAYGLAKEKLLHVPCSEDKEVLYIGLVGEIYTLLEPFASQFIERQLGLLGAEVTRSIYLSEWINEHLFRGLMPGAVRRGFASHASPSLNHFVGGHTRESIGAGVLPAEGEFDGIVQVAPLTCMPEIVAHSIFPSVSDDYQIPVLTIYVDEQTGQAGINTRLEAFIDMLWANRPARKTGKTS
jgi:predicted nucleotide-binding protein (sugar kinase/HSP70/actin superfamily)